MGLIHCKETVIRAFLHVSRGVGVTLFPFLTTLEGSEWWVSILTHTLQVKCIHITLGEIAQN